MVPPEKIWYLWDLAKPESKRRFEWYTMPDNVIKSPIATASMKHLALFIRDESYVQPDVGPKFNKVKTLTRPDPKRKIIPGIVEPYYPPASVPPAKPAPMDEDWI